MGSDTLMTTHDEALSLDQVEALGKVEVVEIAGAGVCRLLAQLDVRVGSVLKVRRVAPLGGPILLECGGSTVAVGRGLARHVQVRLLP